MFGGFMNENLIANNQNFAIYWWFQNWDRSYLKWVCCLVVVWFFMSKPHGYESNNPILLVDVGGIPTILKNDGVRQLGWLSHIWNGKYIIQSCLKPPTSNWWKKQFNCWWNVWDHQDLELDPHHFFRSPSWSLPCFKLFVLVSLFAMENPSPLIKATMTLLRWHDDRLGFRWGPVTSWLKSLNPWTSINYWLVVHLPLWKIWVSWDDYSIPN